MSLFPPTSLTLLQKLAADVTGTSEASWTRFFNLYTPSIRRFVSYHDTVHDPDDVVQDLYLKLVGILREGRFRPDKSKFRTFLALLIRHELISLYRKDSARAADACVSMDDLADELATPASQADELDLAWARARHESAVEHVLTKVALAPQTKAIYRAYVLEERTADAVAAQFGIDKSIVYKVKNRIDQMVRVVEEELAVENS